MLSSLAVGVGVAVGLGVPVAVGLGVALAVGLGVAVAVGRGVAVAVGAGVAVAVGFGVAVAVGLGVGVGVSPLIAALAAFGSRTRKVAVAIKMMARQEGVFIVKCILVQLAVVISHIGENVSLRAIQERLNVCYLCLTYALGLFEIALVLVRLDHVAV